MRLKITIMNRKNTTQRLVYEFSAENEGDIGAAFRDAGRNFAIDYPDVFFDDKEIKLDHA